MNKYNPNIHHRRSIRLKGYDYSQAGMYFITICCQDRAHLFGEIIDGEMNLNLYGQIAYEEWLKTEQIRDNCTLHEFIIMPNHIHGIIEITFKKGENEGNGKFQSPSQTIGSFIRGFKIATIKKIKEKIINSGGTGESRFAQNRINISGFSGELRFAPTEKIKKLNFKIWQRNYYENIIRDHQAYQNISNYIINNPAKWAEDKFHKS